MALVTDNWNLNTLSSTSVSLHLQDNQPDSAWQITSFKIDDGADVKDLVAGTSGTHDMAGVADQEMILSDSIALAGSGTISIDIDGVDADAENFSTSIDFSYAVPMLNRLRLMGTGGISRARFLGGDPDES